MSVGVPIPSRCGLDDEVQTGKRRVPHEKQFKILVRRLPQTFHVGVVILGRLPRRLAVLMDAPAGVLVVRSAALRAGGPVLVVYSCRSQPEGTRRYRSR